MVASPPGDEARHTSGGNAVPDLRLADVPAVAPMLSRARQRLAAWCRAAGLDDGLIEDVALATYEAMANVVDHANDQHGGLFDLSASRRDDLVTVTVHDRGQWKRP
jgi:serine/threonine-protein kinase RsbW